jgi:hypothetical protein
MVRSSLLPLPCPLQADLWTRLLGTLMLRLYAWRIACFKHCYQLNINWLIEHLHSAQIHSIECQGAWLMFWPVLRRCHILRWDWSVLPLTHHSRYAFLSWFLCVSTIVWLTYRDCRIFIVRAWCCECVHTLDLGLSRRERPAQSKKFTVDSVCEATFFPKVFTPHRHMQGFSTALIVSITTVYKQS